jgi:hypothetical protein
MEYLLLNIDWQRNSDTKKMHTRYAYFVYLIEKVFAQLINQFFEFVCWL